MTSTGRYVMYGAEVSYFTGKLRPALRRKGIDFVERLATPQAYREVILPRTGLAFIPVLVTPEGETLQDTSEILDWLERRFPEPALYPRTPFQSVAAHLIEVYADEFLVLPAMHYRWSFPESATKARADFAAVNGDPAAAARFADRMSGSIRALGVCPESIPGIEAHLRDLLAALEELLAGQAFAQGDAPSLADCALMGPLYPHLYLDAVPGRLLRETAPRTCHWIERANHPDPDAPARFLPDDVAAERLRPLLSLAGRDAAPLLLDGLRDFERWADSRAAGAEELPRAVGFHPTQLRGARFQRYTSPYAVWMLQRPQGVFGALAPRERDRVRALLDGTGCEVLLDAKLTHRLGKRRFKLVFETAQSA
jgi:glutathione S-transferase